MKEKIKTTSFWLGLSGLLVIILDCFSKIFEINIVSGVVEDVIITISSMLVLLGIITKKNVNDGAESTKEELLLELNNQERDDESADFDE